jgi:hypothetical protein
MLEVVRARVCCRTPSTLVVEHDRHNESSHFDQSDRKLPVTWDVIVSRYADPGLAGSKSKNTCIHVQQAETKNKDWKQTTNTHSLNLCMKKQTVCTLRPSMCFSSGLFYLAMAELVLWSCKKNLSLTKSVCLVDGKFRSAKKTALGRGECGEKVRIFYVC